MKFFELYQILWLSYEILATFSANNESVHTDRPYRSYLSTAVIFSIIDPILKADHSAFRGP